MARVAGVVGVVLVLVSLAFLVPLWACSPPGGGGTGPAEGSTISGTVPVSFTVTSETEVKGVDLYVDGNYQDTDATAPYSFDWDTTQTTDGAHSVSAKVRAKDRPQGEIKAINVTVKNAATS